MKAPSFQKGEHVIYGTNGLCVIEDVRVLAFSAGQAAELYYILKPLHTAGSVVYVPVNNDVLCQKLRYALTKTGIDALLSGTHEQESLWMDNKTLRAAAFHDALKNGLPRELFDMVRCLYTRKHELLQHGKRLPSGDEAALQSAERLVKEEFSYALKIQQEQVSTYIRTRLDGSANF